MGQHGFAALELWLILIPTSWSGKTHVRKHIRLAYVTVIVTSILAGNASAVCISERHWSALSIRVMQTELMVAALTCDRRESYNAFLRKYKAELISHGYQLRQFFDATYGAQGQRRLDEFVTRLANEASQRSLVDRTSYCPAGDLLFSDVMQARQNLSLLAYKQPFSRTHGISACDPNS
jgi:hypothetical protein